MITITNCYAVWEDDNAVGLISRSYNNWHFLQINDFMSDAKTMRAVAERLDELNAEIEL